MKDVLEDTGARAGQVWVEVCYGTSQVHKSFRRPDSFVIIQYAELSQIGLHKNTRFDLLKTQLLPWSAEHFPSAPGRGTPVVGHLTNHQKVRLRQWGDRMKVNIEALLAGEDDK